ncbi:MAG: DUF4595 domain-containing protein [Roseburia sp.]
MQLKEIHNKTKLIMDKIKKQNAIVIILVLLACVGMVSCGDDESFIVGKPSNIFSNVSPKIVGKYSIYYDEQGRVSMVTERGEYTFRKAFFDYSPADRDCDVRIDIAEENYGEMICLHVSLNKNGYAEYVSEIEDNRIYEDWKFEYNSNGQLIKMVRSEGGSETTTVTYQEGDITKVVQESKFDDCSTSSTIEYGTEKIENKGGVMLFDEMLCIDMDEMGFAYFAGLLGKPTSHLPQSNKSINYSSGGYKITTYKSFSWSLDANRLPVSVLIETKYDNTTSYTKTYSFDWGE